MIPNGQALNGSKHSPGSVESLEIFQQNNDFHTSVPKKPRSERETADIDPLCSEFSNNWGVLMDKWFEGAI